MTSDQKHSERRPNGPPDDLIIALKHHKAGELEKAEILYRRVLQKIPGHHDALHLLGVIELSRGRADQAIQLISRALAAQPHLAQAHSNLGNAFLASGRLTDAIASYRRAIALDPRFAEAYSNLGKALSDQGEFAAAIEICRRGIELAPGIADAHNNLGTALRGAGQFKEAAVALRRAINQAPHRADLHANLGNVLIDLTEFQEAAKSYRQTIQLNPKCDRGYHGLAISLRFLGDMEAAVENLRKAISLNPRQAAMWNELGTALRALGRFDEAVQAFRQASAIAPDFADAYRNLAICQQLAAEGQEITRVAALLARADMPIEDRVAAGFALGKVLDDADRFDEAFAAYAEANRIFYDALASRSQGFDAEALHRVVDETIAHYTPEYFLSVRNWGNPSELPVFIVGMPRSGTSLVEQIAASHSRVFGAGELAEIGNMADRLAAPGSAWNGAEIRRYADAYLDRLCSIGGAAERVTDKRLDNIFKLGLIATLFPSARVVFCRRDPRDIALSCYFQRFSAAQLAFSYDLVDCGRRYNETERLSSHWHQVLPLRTLDIEYEALVGDIEGESRRLISFLGLDWEPTCLDFHRTERTVITASSWQVRQPLYARSVGRWRNYAHHLGALIKVLGNLGNLH